MISRLPLSSTRLPRPSAADRRDIRAEHLRSDARRAASRLKRFSRPPPRRQCLVAPRCPAPALIERRAAAAAEGRRFEEGRAARMRMNRLPSSFPASRFRKHRQSAICRDLIACYRQFPLESGIDGRHNNSRCWPDAGAALPAASPMGHLEDAH